MNNFFNPKHLKGDIFGGLTAGIVALPLALAFGVSSGMGAEAGLYGAMILGTIAAIFGGTNTQISGPTGPMTVVSAAVVATAIAAGGGLDKPETLAIIIGSFLLAGGFQILFGFLKIGKYIKYIPYPVLSGFMTGIGVIIILLQIFPWMGYKSPSEPLVIIQEMWTPISDPNLWAIALGVITMAIIYLFPRITKAIPSGLVALLVVTIFSTAMKLDVPLIGDIPSGIPALKISVLGSLSGDAIFLILKFGFMLAALGAIDSLLTSVIADNITKTKHNSNKELIGQGLGNMAAAIFGGLPGAGATMRTVVNVNSGGKTKLSGIVHGVLLIAILLGLGTYVAYIPLSVLAGILITVGVGIIDYKGLNHLNKVPRTDAVILVLVLAFTVFWNLLIAVGVGVVLACVIFMKQASDETEKQSELRSLGDGDPWDDETDLIRSFKHQVYIKHLNGALFFGFTSKFQEIVSSLDNDVRVLIIRMKNAPYIDQSGIYALEDSIKDLEASGVTVVLTSVQPQPMRMLRKIALIPDLVPERHVFPTFTDCEKWIKHNLQKEDAGFDNMEELTA
jgi:SulP family sulfate permease